MYVVLMDFADDLLPRVSSIRCGEPGVQFLRKRLSFSHFLLFFGEPRDLAYQMESFRLALGVRINNGERAALGVRARTWIHRRVDASRGRRRRRRHAILPRRWGRRRWLRPRHLRHDLLQVRARHAALHGDVGDVVLPLYFVHAAHVLGSNIFL